MTISKTTLRQYDLQAQELLAKIMSNQEPLPGNREERLSRQREYSANAFEYFLKTYLSHHFYEDFSKSHREYFQTLINNPNSIIAKEAFRGWGKSTIDMGYAIWQALNKRVHFVPMISDTEDQAALTFSLTIKTELESNPAIIEDFGNQESQLWAIDEFVTTGGTMFRCYGRMSKIRGGKYIRYRYDLALIDDFENDKNVKNPAIVEDGIRLLFRVLRPAMAKSGYQILYSGTPLGKRTVLEELRRRGIDGAVIFLSYPIYRITKLGLKRLVWPEAYSWNDVKKLESDMGSRAFRQEMLLEILSEDSPFQPEWVRYADDQEINSKQLLVFTYADPSFKTRGKSRKAIVTIGVDIKTKIKYVLNAYIRRSSVFAFGNKIYDIHDQFPPVSIGGESNAIGEFMEEAFKLVSQIRGKHISLKMIHHGSMDNKWARIVSLSADVEKGQIRFRKGQSDQDLLVQQLLDTPADPGGKWPDGNDGPDALEGAISLYRKTVGAAIDNVEVF